MNISSASVSTFLTLLSNFGFTALIFLLVLSLSYFLFFCRRLRLKHSSINSLPPGPVPWPIVGSLPELLRNKPRFRWVLRLMEDMNADIACIRLGNVHVIPVNCPEIAQEFLKKYDAVFASRPITMATYYSSRGFLSVVDAPLGKQWKKMRRVVASHVLNSSRLRGLVHRRREEADNLVKYIYSQCTKNQLKSNSDNGLVNVRTAAWQYSGNVVRKMMFSKRYFGKGKEDGGPGVEEEEYVAAIVTILLLLNAFCVSDYLPWLRWLDLDGHERKMKESIRIVNKYHDPIIDERIQRWRSSAAAEGENWKNEPQDLLDVLISVKDDNEQPLLSTEEIKAQVADLVYAAIDNPSNAVEWALAEMMNQPQSLEKAVSEIDRVVGRDELVTETHLPHLHYVAACAREAFRLHPVAPFNVPHVSVAEATVAGYFIPKSSHVLLGRVGLGRNPNVWRDPLAFKPERHLQSPDGLTRPVQLTEPELRFISFTTGRRGCMGSELGSEMTLMLLARLLHGFTWSLPPGTLTIDLSESTDDLFLAKPLVLQAKPRLAPHIYPIN